MIDNEARDRVIRHRLLDILQHGPVARQALSLDMGQYWQPIHYFAEFLARCIAIMGDIELRSRASLILYQELGLGDSKRAHESLYLDAAQQAGISTQDVVDAEPLPQTLALMTGFREATTSRTRAIGYLYATEIIDLRLVKSLGAAITRASGGAIPEWVKVHEQQEGDHVTAAKAMIPLLTPVEGDEVVEYARIAWTKWQHFYDGVEAAFNAGSAEVI